MTVFISSFSCEKFINESLLISHCLSFFGCSDNQNGSNSSPSLNPGDPRGVPGQDLKLDQLSEVTDTNKNSFTISGTCLDGGGLITITVEDEVIGEDIPCTDGRFSLTADLEDFSSDSDTMEISILQKKNGETVTDSLTTDITINDPPPVQPIIPSFMELVNPKSSPSENTNPVIRVKERKPGDTVELFTDSECTHRVAIGAVPNNATSVDLNICEPGTCHENQLTPGHYKFYEKSSNDRGSSGCSQEYLEYFLDPDPGAPRVPAAMILVESAIRVLGVNPENTVSLHTTPFCNDSPKGIGTVEDGKSYIDLTVLDSGLNPGDYVLYSKTGNFYGWSKCSDVNVRYTLTRPEDPDFMINPPFRSPGNSQGPSFIIRGLPDYDVTVSIFRGPRSTSQCTDTNLISLGDSVSVNASQNEIAIDLGNVLENASDGIYKFFARIEGGPRVHCFELTYVLDTTAPRIIANTLEQNPLENDDTARMSKTWNWSCVDRDGVNCTYRYKIDETAPTISNVSVPSRTYAGGDRIDFTVTFSEAVTVEGTPRIPLILDGGGTSQTKYAEYTSGTGTNSLVFRYEVGQTDLDTNGIGMQSSIDLNSGSLEDSSSNAVSPLTFTLPTNLSDVLVSRGVPNVVLSLTELSVEENGGTGTYQIRLNSEPTSAVTLALGSADSSVATVSPGILSFSTDNWSSPQTVTVTGVNDSIDNDAGGGSLRTVNITHTVTSSDTDYNNFSVSPVEITSNDNDDIGSIRLTVNPSSIDEHDSGSSRSIANNTETIVVIASFHGSTSGGSPNSRVRLSGPLTISASLEAGTAQTGDFNPVDFDLNIPAGSNQVIGAFSLTLVDDELDDNDETLLVSGSTPLGLTINPATITIVDNDDRGLIISHSSLSVSENGGTGTYTVNLESEPTGSVTILVTSGDTSIATVLPTSLTFEPDDTNGKIWNTPQPVTVTGVNDTSSTNDRHTTITHQVSGGGYGSLTVANVSVTSLDASSPTQFWAKWVPRNNYATNELEALIQSVTSESDASSPFTLTFPPHDQNDYFLLVLDNGKTLTGEYDGSSAEGINQIGAYIFLGEIGGKKFYVSENQLLHELLEGREITLTYVLMED